MWHSRLTIGLAAGWVAAGCASTPALVETAPVDRRADVEALVRAGCYACLREALALVDDGHALDRRFDILALLAARVREIGYDDGHDWRGRAEAATPPAPSTRNALFLKLVDQTPGPQGSGILPGRDLAPSERLELTELSNQVWPTRPQDPVEAYFHLTVACLRLADTPLATWAGEPADDNAPLVRFRRATCMQVHRDELARVVASEPRFADAHYFEAIAEFGGGSLLSTERALDRFEEVFPGTTSAAFLRGQVLLALDEFVAASAAFERVLDAAPQMPEALLFNARALSQVDPRRGEAAADRLLALGTWYPGEGYYWRAWNRRALRRLDDASSDIDKAKPVLFNAAVPKLAGFIAYERGDMLLAERELTESLGRNDADCEVQFALGQVLARTDRWGEGGARFRSAATCSRLAQSALAARLQEIAAADLDPARRERLAGRVERDRTIEHRREGLALLSGAAAFARANRPGDARPLAEAARGWPELQKRSHDLLATLRP
jgi:tetratricopeptide (TPR) repeat protein